MTVSLMVGQNAAAVEIPRRFLLRYPYPCHKRATSVNLTPEKIRTAAAADRVKWRYHALRRAMRRGISRQQAKDVIRTGEIIEEHPDAEPFPKCLLMAEVQAGKPLYVSLAYDEADDYIYIVTVHWLDPEKWEDPWTRKP